MRPATPFDGIFAGQIVEHLPPEQLPRMIKLCAARLKPGGVLVDRNTESGVPGDLRDALLYRSDAHTSGTAGAFWRSISKSSDSAESKCIDVFPQSNRCRKLANLPEMCRRKFFGGLDYAITWPQAVRWVGAC